MISTDLSEKILSIGCSYKHPKGGVAQVLHSYNLYVYEKFSCVVNSGSNRKLGNLLIAIFSFVKFWLKLQFCLKIKIVHIHTASYNSFKRSALYVRLGHVYKKKIVLHIHGAEFHLFYKNNTKRVDEIFKKVDCVAALSDSWKKFFEKETKHKKVVVVPNIVDNPVVYEKSTDGKTHVLFLGILDDRKGVYDLLSVLASHRNEFEQKVILHVGGNGDTQAFKKTVSVLSLEDIVHFEGWVTGEKKQRLLSQADIYILPSYNEGLPISILEAMSYGLPILSTPVGGIPEVVEDGLNGFLFVPGDKENMYKYLMMLLENTDLRYSQGQESLKKIKPYLPINVEFVLEKLYTELL